MENPAPYNMIQAQAVAKAFHERLSLRGKTVACASQHVAGYPMAGYFLARLIACDCACDRKKALDYSRGFSGL